MILGNMYFFFFYKVKLPFFEKYKSVPDPWPWETNKQEWDKLFWRSVKLSLFNAVVMNTLLSVPTIVTGQAVPWRYDYNFDSPLRMFVMLILCSLIENLGFYTTHYFLHTPLLYKHIHKIHHEHKVTTSIAAIHAHPLEYLIGNAIPSSLGPFLLGQRMHMSSFFAWNIYRIFNAVSGHSGYDFSWSPFRCFFVTADGKEHAFHHFVNIGNYSASIWDVVFGTNHGSKTENHFKSS